MLQSPYDELFLVRYVETSLHHASALQDKRPGGIEPQVVVETLVGSACCEEAH